MGTTIAQFVKPEEDWGLIMKKGGTKMATLKMEHLLNLVNASGFIKEGISLKDLEEHCSFRGSKRFCRIQFKNPKQAKQFVKYLEKTYQAEGNTRGKFAYIRIKIN